MSNGERQLQGTWRFEDFQLDGDRGELWHGREFVPLSPKEFETLRVLIENAGRLVSKEELIARVWPDSFVGDGSLARNVSALRKYLGPDAIQTVARRGYRFVPSVIFEPSSQRAPQTVNPVTIQSPPADANATSCQR